MATQQSGGDPKCTNLASMQEALKDIKVDEFFRGSIPVNIEQRCLELCRDYIGGSWSNAKSSTDLIVEQICGGFTNQLYRVQLKDSVVKVERNQFYPDEPHEVAVKLYQTKLMKSYSAKEGERLNDIIVLAVMSQLGIGPRVYGDFEDGAIIAYHKHEQFRVKHQQQPALLRQVAQKLARIHSLVLPIRKQPWQLRECRAGIEFCYSTTDVPKLVEELNLDQFKRRDLAVEFADLERILERANVPLVFCHNDFRGCNMLVTTDAKEQQKVLICDLEYANYGPRAYDIAAFMLEWGKDPTMADLTNITLPPMDAIEHFVQLYREAMDELQPGYSSRAENSTAKLVIETRTYFLALSMFIVVMMFRQTESPMPGMPFDEKTKMAIVNQIYKGYFAIKDELMAEATA